LIKLYAPTTNGPCVVFFENRECIVLKFGIAAVQFSSFMLENPTKVNANTCVSMRLES